MGICSIKKNSTYFEKITLYFQEPPVFNFSLPSMEHRFYFIVQDQGTCEENCFDQESYWVSWVSNREMSIAKYIQVSWLSMSIIMNTKYTGWVFDFYICFNRRFLRSKNFFTIFLRSGCWKLKKKNFDYI